MAAIGLPNGGQVVEIQGIEINAFSKGLGGSGQVLQSFVATL